MPQKRSRGKMGWRDWLHESWLHSKHLILDFCIFQNMNNQHRFGIFRNKISIHLPSNIEEN